MVTSLLRWIVGLLSSQRLFIVTYHRVLATDDPILQDEPSRAKFTTHLDWIARHTQVLPLDEACHKLANGTLPRLSLCITFDDGYENNLSQAAPELKRRALPATCFVASGAVEAGIMWNDLVIEAVRRLPGHCELSSLPITPAMGAWELRCDADRNHLSGEILSRIKYMQAAARLEVAEKLFALTGESHPPRLMMTPEQVAELAEYDIQVAGHTHSHPILATLDDESATQEIAQNKALLESWSGKKVTTFAYPNGKPGQDFTARDQSILQRQEFICGVSTQWGVADRDSDPFALPRFSIEEPSEFSFLVRLLKLAVQSRLGRA